MTSKLTVDTIQNIGNTSSLVVNNFSLTGRYIRKLYTQVDITNRSSTTTWTLGPTFEMVTGFLPDSVLRLDYFVPARNDSTSWGGMYLEPQIKINDNPWESLGSTGYDVVMMFGTEFIGSYSNTIFIDPSQKTPFSVQFRFYFRSYDGTVGWNNGINHNINVVSGTASIMSGNNGLQNYAHIIVQELAPFS